MTQPQMLDETFSQKAEEFYELALKLSANWGESASGKKVTGKFIGMLIASPKEGYLLIDEKMKEGALKAVKRQRRLISGATASRVLEVAKETCQIQTDFEKLAKLWEELVEEQPMPQTVAARMLQDRLRHHLF